MICIGIDPGFDGAIGFVGGGLDAFCGVHDTPCFATTKKSGKPCREYNAARMVEVVREMVGDAKGKVVAAVERVHAMPKAGAVGMFSFGKGYGLWIGVLAALGVPYDLVEPTRWKKAMLDGMGKEKDAARFRAQQLFPGVDLSLKKHHGRAEALLIAEYRRRLG